MSARAEGPKRRVFAAEYGVFTAEYKAAGPPKYDEGWEPGAEGAILRGQGLYTSYLIEGRHARDPAGVAFGRPPRDRRAEQVLALQARAHRVEAELAKAQAALEIVEKLHAPSKGISENAEPLALLSPRRYKRSKREPYLPSSTACALVGRSWAMHCRRRRGSRLGPGRHAAEPSTALTAGEREPIHPVFGQPLVWCARNGRLDDLRTRRAAVPRPGAARPHSRPRVLSVTPYREAAFKTLNDAPLHARRPPPPGSPTQEAQHTEPLAHNCLNELDTFAPAPGCATHSPLLRLGDSRVVAT